MDRLEVAKGVEATRDFALFLRDERALVISDLHLGFEGALAEQGVSIPRFQRRGVLGRLGQRGDPGGGGGGNRAGGLQDAGFEEHRDRGGRGERGLRVVDGYSYPYLSPILNRTPIDDARVIGVDEKEGLLDFGTVDGLKSMRAALLMK